MAFGPSSMAALKYQTKMARVNIPQPPMVGPGARVPAASDFGDPIKWSDFILRLQKHALIGFFDSVRAELYDHGVQVSTILPGYIRTEISLHAMNEQGEKYGKMDPNQAKGLDPQITAQKIVHAVSQGKNYFFVGGALERFGLIVQRLFPSIVPWMLRKIKNT